MQPSTVAGHEGARQLWLAGVKVVALDLTDTHRSGLHPHLSHARRVADPFHVIRVGNRMVDEVRRRVQNETMGHRGRSTAQDRTRNAAEAIMRASLAPSELQTANSTRTGALG